MMKENTNITIFKTYSYENGSYDYWEDELPSHNLYDFIIGQRIVDSFIINKYCNNPEKFLQNCYEDTELS